MNSYNSKTISNIISQIDLLQDDISAVRILINDLTEIFFSSIQDKNPSKNYIPIIVLRGGLLCFNAAAKVFKNPIGLVLPTKNMSIAYDKFFADIPRQKDGDTYLIIDTICNSGGTIIDCLESLSKHGIDIVNCELCYIFGSKLATENIQKYSSNISVHYVKNDYVKGPDGFLIGIDYDAGQYAVNQKNRDRIVI